jgi:protein arginine N-methyltransferase 1
MVLQLAPGVRARLDAARHVQVDAPDGTIIDLGPRGFAILSLFTTPLSFGDAIEHLEQDDHRSTDLLPAVSVISMLVEEGALVDPDSSLSTPRGWADPVEHARMLHDQVRTGDYIAALAAAVRPGDVVLDIGTGSGVLAVAAARAGARRVYAVESSDIAEVAARVFEANGVRDRVTLVTGWSREIELPERADVLVSEIIGNEPLEEEILETTLDARQRHLKPRARLIPNSLTLIARPLLIPESEARQRTVGRSAIERWQALYGIDFHPLLEASAQGPVNFPTEGELACTWPPAGPPAVVATLNLATLEIPSVTASADLLVDAGAAVNGVAITFRAGLHGGISHELDPWRRPASSWATSVWVLPRPLVVGPRSALRVRYSRRARGAPDGLTCEIVTRDASLLKAE